MLKCVGNIAHKTMYVLKDIMVYSLKNIQWVMVVQHQIGVIDIALIYSLELIGFPIYGKVFQQLVELNIFIFNHG